MSRLYHIFILTSVFSVVLLYAANTMPADSLWERRTTVNYNLFDDNRGKRVGDIVTVVVIEETSVDSDEDCSTQN